jgi:hypothetical protein
MGRHNQRSSANHDLASTLEVETLRLEKEELVKQMAVCQAKNEALGHALAETRRRLREAEEMITLVSCLVS